MAEFWDMVGKAANLFQLFGVDAITLVAIAASFLRFHEMNKECRKLEESMRMLGALLHSPAGCWIMQQQGHLEELGRLLASALRDAHKLVESYDRSTLLARLRRGRGMATAMRDLRSSIDSYCGLIVSVNALVLVLEGDSTASSLLVIR